jgi:uncharacterized protein (DUF433 family)
MWRKHIVAAPNVVAGQPKLRGTRISVAVMLEELAGGATVPELAEDFEVDEAAINAALECAAHATRRTRLKLPTEA